MTADEGSCLREWPGTRVFGLTSAFFVAAELASRGREQLVAETRHAVVSFLQSQIVQPTGIAAETPCRFACL